MQRVVATLLIAAALAGPARAQSVRVRAQPGPLQAPSPGCPAQALLPAAVAPAGEKLRLHLDIYGADVGTMELWTERPALDERDAYALIAHARLHTSAFVNTNSAGYSALATAKLGPGLVARAAHEEVDDNGVHWVDELELPPKLGKLAVRASKDGEPASLSLAATPLARDLLSTFYAIRAVPLAAGSPICFEVYAGRHLWKMTGAVGPREALDTPLGKLACVRVDLSSVRIDDPRITRTARFWLSDDARRLPVAAIAEVRGKVLRAQLTSASGRGWSLGQVDP